MPSLSVWAIDVEKLIVLAIRVRRRAVRVHLSNGLGEEVAVKRFAASEVIKSKLDVDAGWRARTPGNAFARGGGVGECSKRRAAIVATWNCALSLYFDDDGASGGRGRCLV